MKSLWRWLKYIFYLSLTVFIGLFVLAYIYLAPPQTVPNFVPVDLSKTGVVADLKFKVKTEFPYRYMIEFTLLNEDPAEKERLRKLVGSNVPNKQGNSSEPRIPTPLRLKIFAACPMKGDVEILSMSSDPILWSWGAGGNIFRKRIDEQILPPGNYRAQLINERASPEFSISSVSFNIRAHQGVSYDPDTNPNRIEPCRI